MASWTQEDLDALEEAMAQSVRKVEYNDRTVTYTSLAEMRELREMMRRSLGLVKRSSAILCRARKGTC